VEDEKRGNTFVLRDVSDRGVVAMFRRVIPEFFAVTPFRLLQTMNAAAGFSRLNHRGDVESVAIDRNTSLDDSEGETFGFQIAIVYGNQGGELRAGGMAHDENAIRVSTILPDVVVDPMNGFRDVAKNINHLDVRQQAVARGDEDEAAFHESLRFQLNARAIPCLPTAPMNPENH